MTNHSSSYEDDHEIRHTPYKYFLLDVYAALICLSVSKYTSTPFALPEVLYHGSLAVLVVSSGAIGFTAIFIAADFVLNTTSYLAMIFMSSISP